MYLERYFDKKKNDMSKAIVEDIRDAFKETISQTQWFDANTKKHAEEKIEALTSNVEFQTELVPNFVLNILYPSVSISSRTIVLYIVVDRLLAFRNVDHS